MIHALGALRAHRTAVLIMLAFALIVAGVWVGAVAIFGALGGTAAGLFAGGVALLVLEGLSE